MADVPLTYNNGRGTVEENDSVELLKFFDSASLITNSVAHYGDEDLAGGGAQVNLDVSKYSKRLLTFTNKYDAPVVINLIQAHHTNSNGNDAVFNILNPSEAITLNAGDRVSISADNFPLLDKPFKYLWVRVARGATTPTTGTLKVRFYGGN